MTTAIIAPARLASTRFPEKLLHPIGGKSLILWVADRLREQVPDCERFFAIDDPRLADVLTDAGHQWVMTRKDHASGTDRLAEANRIIGADIVINVQADEPLVTKTQIQSLSQLLEGDADMATLATRFTTRKDFLNPNQVKVVKGGDDRALYFSRAPIPHNRDEFEVFDDQWVAETGIYRHLGLYAYRADFLETFCGLPEGKLESIEKLEQLRVLEAGYQIAVGITDEPSIGIDTEEDVRAFERRISIS